MHIDEYLKRSVLGLKETCGAKAICNTFKFQVAP